MKKNERIVRINRKYKKFVTLGKLSSDLLPIELSTIELLFKNNKPYISCIPEGKYLVKKTYSGKSKKLRWEIMGVEGRTVIRIDKANYVKELQGCVAVGMSHADINSDGIIDVKNSETALELMKRYLPDEFTLIISKAKIDFGIKAINKKTPDWIRKIGTALITIGTSGSLLFVKLGSTKGAFICGGLGLLGKLITKFFGEK
jgi:hypothetical protein